MRILVTGSEGTLGKPLVRELERHAHRVFGVSLSHTEKDDHMRADISMLSQIAGAIRYFDPDIVYNLAAEFGRHNGEEYPEQLWNTNVVGMKNLLALQKVYSFKLIHASSSEVYGEGPFDREYIDEGMTDRVPLKHHNDYAMSKWVNEEQIRNSGQKVTVLRFFNAYGPGERYHKYRSVVCLFVYKALMGQPYTVYRNYHRVFMYIDDFIQSLANAVLAPSITINLGGREYCSIEKLDDIIRRQLGDEFRSTVTYLDQDAHNTVNKRPDIALAQQYLRHMPRTKLEDGVRKTIEWMRKEYSL